MADEERVQEMFELEDGTTGSRADYIRQEFKKDRSRGEIAKELDVPYHTVYSATVNMFNEAHPERGGGGSKTAIVEHPETGEQKPRTEVVRDLYGEYGWSRGQIKDHFEISYGAVYQATKDMGSTSGGKKMIEHPETGEQVARVDFIREKWAEGLSRREIADMIGCDYAIVWAATAEKKEDKEEEAEEQIDEPEDEELA